VPLNFGAWYAGPEATRPYFPDFRYHLSDLTTYSDEESRGQVTLQVALLVVKHIFRDDLPDRLPGILSVARELAQKRTGLEFLETLLRYVTLATDRVTTTDLQEAVDTAFPEIGRTLMTTLAERWMEQGVQQATHDYILEVLETRFDHVPEDIAYQVKQVNDVSLLKRLHRQALTIDSLGAFGDLMNDVPDQTE
jgi:hypothetical protein